MARQPRGLSGFPRDLDDPAASLALRIAAGRQPIGRGKFRVELDRLVEMSERVTVGLLCPQMNARHAAQIMIVSVEILRRLAPRSIDLRLFHFRCDGADNAAGYLVLEIEDVL